MESQVNIADLAFRSHCPVARSLDLVGDKWTLLIMRDALFFGPQDLRRLRWRPRAHSYQLAVRPPKEIGWARLAAQTAVSRATGAI